MNFTTIVLVFAASLWGWCGYVNTAHSVQPKLAKMVHLWRVATPSRCDDTDWLCLVTWANENKGR